MFGTFLLQREIRTLLRTRRAFWFLVLAVAGASLLPILAWAQAGGGRSGGAATFLAFAWAQLTAALLAVPAFAASAIAGERERGTWDLLLAARVPFGSIVMAKAISAGAYVLVVLIATAPATLIFFFLGGVSFAAIFASLTITLASVVLAVSVVLHQSAQARSTGQAAMLGTLWFVLWAVAVVLPMALVVRWIDRRQRRVGVRHQGITEDSFAYWLCVAFIAAALTLFLWPALKASFTYVCPYAAVYVCLTSSQSVLELHLGLSVAFSLAAAAFHFARMILADESQREEEGTVPRQLPLSPEVAEVAAAQAKLMRALGRHDVRALPGIRLRRVTIQRTKKSPRSLATTYLLRRGHAGTGPLANPIFRKELQTELLGSQSVRGPIFWGTFIAAFISPMGGMYFLGYAIASAVAIIVLPAVVSTALLRELELGNLDFLRGARLEAASIINGKLLAAMSFGVGLTVPPFVVCVSISPLLGIGSNRTLRDFLVMQCANLSCATAFAALVTLVATLSMVASLVCRSSLQAMALSYAASFTLLAAPPLAAAFALDGIPEQLGWITPFTSFLRAHIRDYPGLFRFPWGTLGFAAAATGVSIVLWLDACARFEAKWMRDT